MRPYAVPWTGFVLVVALLALWELSVASGAVRSASWPALSQVLGSLQQGFRGEGWFAIFGSTLYRMAIGFLIAVVLGVAAGLVMGASSRVQRTFMPTVEIFRVLPIPAVVPPLIFFLGVDDPLKITVIALASFFPIALNAFAGVRAVDIRDPYAPKEIGYYIPAITEETDRRCNKTAAGMQCKHAIQSNNVEVDDRGYIYVADRANTGLHILELTGAARRVANFK